jgi:glycogen phosphorylase
MYKLVAFDMDGTIADSKQPITKEMAELLHKLSLVSKVAIISGGSFTRFEDQVLRSLKPSPNIILLPAEGSERFEYVHKKWTMTDKNPFPPELKEKVTSLLQKIIADPKYEGPPYPVGEYVEDRDTEIAFSGLGQNAPLSEKEKWDPDKTRRLKIKEVIEKEIPEVVAAVAGTTSIDILPRGFDKAKGLSLFLEKSGLKPEDMVFVGDAIIPGGNDYSVFAAGIKSIPVDGPADTMEIIRKILQDNDTTPKTHAVPHFPKDPVAYFCAEYGFEPNTLMYAGGLGILAGDMLLQSADLDLSFIAVGLRYGTIIPTDFYILKNVIIEIPIKNELVKAQVWHRAFSKNTHALLLDTNIPENTEAHKKITSHIYDADFYTRVYQQIVLGVGGIRLLKHLKINPRVYHLNEGHTAFAAVGLMVERHEDLGKIVGSKHTILSEAGLLIQKKDVEEILGSYAKEHHIDVDDVFEKGKFELDNNLFSTTKMVMMSSLKKNAVSGLHAVYEKKRHPHSTLFAITNGVYRKRWQARELMMRSPAMTDEELTKIKRKLRLDLFSYIETTTGKKFNPDICTLVWSRRFAAYKRPYLMFSDLKRLTDIITNAEHPLQIVISGKAHPADELGQSIVKKILDFSNSTESKGRVVYLPDYNVISAEKLTRGADIWLNTPELGKEACGTSGMKASLNGSIQVSVRDGWVDEVNWEGMGWSLPDANPEKTAEALYDLLEHEILPCYYGLEHAHCVTNWAQKMRSTIELVEKSYTADRMIRDYEEKLYTW